MRVSCFLLILIAFFHPLTAFCSKDKAHFKRPTLTPTIEQFFVRVEQNYFFTPNLPFAHLRKIIGKTQFLPIDYMRASQVSFGFLTAQDKIERAKEEFGAKWDEEKGRWLFNKDNDHGRSLFPERRNALGVLGPDGIYVVDGHHKILTSLYYGATTYPITLIEDLSVDKNGKPYTREEFRALMKERGHLFLTMMDGSEADWVPLLHKMTNDPNRFFVTLITMKLKIKIKDGDAKIKEQKGSTNPVIIKIGRDAEFFEFEFAKRLHAAGIHYDDAWGKNPPLGFIEKAAEILWQMRETGDPFLNDVLMFPVPMDISKEDLEKILNEFLKGKSHVCQTLMTDPYF